MKVPIFIEQSLIDELINACAEVDAEATRHEGRGALQTPIKTSHQDAINRRLHAWHSIANAVSKNLDIDIKKGEWWHRKLIVERISNDTAITWTFWEHDKCGSLIYLADMNDNAPAFCPRCCRVY